MSLNAGIFIPRWTGLEVTHRPLSTQVLGEPRGNPDWVWESEPARRRRELEEKLGIAEKAKALDLLVNKFETVDFEEDLGEKREAERLAWRLERAERQKAVPHSSPRPNNRRVTESLSDSRSRSSSTTSSQTLKKLSKTKKSSPTSSEPPDPATLLTIPTPVSERGAAAAVRTVIVGDSRSETASTAAELESPHSPQIRYKKGQRPGEPQWKSVLERKLRDPYRERSSSGLALHDEFGFGFEKRTTEWVNQHLPVPGAYIITPSASLLSLRDGSTEYVEDVPAYDDGENLGKISQVVPIRSRSSLKSRPTITSRKSYAITPSTSLLSMREEEIEYTEDAPGYSDAENLGSLRTPQVVPIQSRSSLKSRPTSTNKKSNLISSTRSELNYEVGDQQDDPQEEERMWEDETIARQQQEHHQPAHRDVEIVDVGDGESTPRQSQATLRRQSRSVERRSLFFQEDTPLHSRVPSGDLSSEIDYGVVIPRDGSDDGMFLSAQRLRHNTFGVPPSHQAIGLTSSPRPSFSPAKFHSRSERDSMSSNELEYVTPNEDERNIHRGNQFVPFHSGHQTFEHDDENYMSPPYGYENTDDDDDRTYHEEEESYRYPEPEQKEFRRDRPLSVIEEESHITHSSIIFAPRDSYAS